MKWRNGVLLACITALLVSCAGLKAEPEREAQADLALKQTASGDAAGMAAQMAPGNNPATIPPAVAQMRSLLPAGPIPGGKSVTWTRTAGPAGESYELVREYDYPAHVVVAETVMVKVDGRWLVNGFHIRVATDAQLKATQFSLIGKTPLHYGVFAAMIIVPLFIVVTFGFALYRRRWGWALFSLFGFAALQLNWATGAWGISPIHFLLLGAAFLKAGSAFAPWIFSVSFPLGAVLFWMMGKNKPKPLRSKKAKAASRSEAEPVSEPDDFTPVSLE